MEPYVEIRSLMQRQTKLRTLYAAILLFALAVISPPLIQINRFRNTLTDSLTRALGRKVTCGDIHLHLLPRPGFDITNLSVADDPSYGAEPILVAGEVKADLRLASFWSRRIEVAHLTLKYPSLNVALQADGHWNIEPLLVRAAQAKTAPTTKVQAEARPRFPYIEAESGRINFRSGAHKLAFAITDSDFSLWLESEDKWNIRFKARPMRTDANLTDTGNVVVNGSFGRAEELHSIPLSLQVQIEKMQLGQLTTLLFGQDKGWRGEMSAVGQFSGTTSNIEYTSKLLVRGFHRYDIQMPGSVDLPLSCSGKLAMFPKATNVDSEQMASGFECVMPFASGELKVTKILSTNGPPDQNLHLQALHVPVTALIPILKQMKYALPSDLLGTGGLNADFMVHHDVHTWIWDGSGVLNDVELQSQTLGQQLKVTSITFGAGCVNQTDRKDTQSRPGCTPRGKHLGQIPHARTVHFDPFVLVSGTNEGTNIEGDIDEMGTHFHAKGIVATKTLAAETLMLGLRPIIMDMDGPVNFDLDLDHNWTGFTPVRITGNLRLIKNTINLPGSTATIDITNASIQLANENISIKNLAAVLHGTNTIIQGEITLPRDCVLSTCTVKFALKSNSIDLSKWSPYLAQQTSSNARSSNAAEFFSMFKETMWFRQGAKGSWHTGSLILDGVQLTNAKALMEWKDSKLTFSEIHGVAKKVHGPSWTSDFDGILPNSSVHLVFLSPTSKTIRLKEVLEQLEKPH